MGNKTSFQTHLPSKLRRQKTNWTQIVQPSQLQLPCAVVVYNIDYYIDQVLQYYIISTMEN